MDAFGVLENVWNSFFFLIELSPSGLGDLKSVLLLFLFKNPLCWKMCL